MYRKKMRKLASKLTLLVASNGFSACALAHDFNKMIGSAPAATIRYTAKTEMNWSVALALWQAVTPLFEIETTGQSYAEKREALLAEGWIPSVTAEHSNCDVYADLCKDRPEVDQCDLTGPVPRCRWLWVRASEQLMVVTILDNDEVEHVSIYKKRSNR